MTRPTHLPSAGLFTLCICGTAAPQTAPSGEPADRGSFAGQKKADLAASIAMETAHTHLNATPPPLRASQLASGRIAGSRNSHMPLRANHPANWEGRGEAAAADAGDTSQ